MDHDDHRERRSQSRRRIVFALVVLAVVPAFFWAVAVIEGQGFFPDHPDAPEVVVEEDDGFDGESRDAPLSARKKKDPDEPSLSERVRLFVQGQPIWVLLVVPVGLAGLALLMHRRQSRKARRRYLGLRRRGPGSP